MRTISFSPVNIEERKKIDIRPGDTVRVWIKIEEKGKTRLQQFEGLVIARKHGTESGATFTVRKIASGVGVEKIFPLYSPVIDKIEIIRRARVRRAKLYYIREKSAKDVRRKMKRFGDFVPVSYEERAPAEEQGEEKEAEGDEKEEQKEEGKTKESGKEETPSKKQSTEEPKT